MNSASITKSKQRVALIGLGMAVTPHARALRDLSDRVEVVHFPDPGRYLVICGVLPHFNDGMYGYVEVIP